jgi:hypothetical protein
MANYVEYMDPSDSTRGPSPSVWGSFAADKMQPGVSVHVFDDFHTYDNTATVGDYSLIVDSGGTSAIIADEAGATDQPHSLGLLQLDGDGTAQDGIYVSWPLLAATAAAGPFRANGQDDLLAFEIRFKVDSVADDSASFQIGFTEEGTIAAGSIIDTTHEPLASSSVIGWRQDETDGDSAVPFYIEGGASISEGTGQAIAASTYYKMGFVLDGNRARWYLDGEKVREIDNVNSETAWPDADRFCFCVGSKVGTGAAAVETSIDWIRLGYVAGS